MRSRFIALVLTATLALSACASVTSAPAPATRTLRSGPISMSGGAPASGCPTHYLERTWPQVSSGRADETLNELCYEEFAVLHSSWTLTPLWSAEHLTRAMARGADRISREGSYYAEPALEGEPRATPSDYTNSGFDRGHMTPADDMPDHDAQSQTFTMANMAPQAPDLNQIRWQALEGALHVLAEQHGGLYIVTGPLFEDAPDFLNGRVGVPFAFFKAVYDPRTERAIVYFAANEDDAACEVISLNALQQHYGVDAFPSLRGAIRNQRAVWPLPNGHRRPAPTCTPG